MTGKQILKRLRLPFDIPNSWWKSSTLAGWHPLKAALLLAGVLRDGYWPSEAFRLGLLHPEDGRKLRKVHVSKRHMVRVQQRINPKDWTPLIGDKGIFYSFCQAAGIRVPEIYALLYPATGGRTASGRILRTDEEWEQFFGRDCPSPFVVKPTRGDHGLGILLVEREGGRLNAQRGKEYSVGDFVNLLRREMRYEGYVVQKRMTNHPSLARLVTGPGLATLRLITFAPPDAGCDIIHADLKIPMGGNLISNLSLGISGNMVAHVSTSDGKLTGGVKIERGRGFVRVERHPESGMQLNGYQLPFWGEARAVVMNAAAAVLPVRMVGWDVILSREGAMILEGNFSFDPPNSSLRAAEILRIITSK